jgi:hypothetical protein
MQHGDTRDEARQIAVNIAQLPESLKRAQYSHGMAALREPFASVCRESQDGTHLLAPCVNDARPAPRDAGLFFARSPKSSLTIERPQLSSLWLGPNVINASAH